MLLKMLVKIIGIYIYIYPFFCSLPRFFFLSDEVFSLEKKKVGPSRKVSDMNGPAHREESTKSLLH